MFCNRTSTWHRPRRVRPVRSAADALEVIALAMSRPPRPETIAFLLDDAGIGTTVLVVDGTQRADALIDVIELVAEAGAMGGATALVVASVRPSPPAPDAAVTLTDDDVERWLEASDIAADNGLELLEWFVVGPTGITCPRELFGEPPRWPQAA